MKQNTLKIAYKEVAGEGEGVGRRKVFAAVERERAVAAHTGAGLERGRRSALVRVKVLVPVK